MHVLWKFGREVCSQPACFRCTLASGRPPQLWRGTGLIQRAVRHIDAFLGPSVFTIRMHQERGLRGTMVQLPGFSPDPEAAVEHTGQENEGRPYFLFCGRLEKIKGVHAIIPIFRGQDVDLLIAGTGGFEGELRSMASNAANIKFIGQIDYRRLQSLYRDAVATIVPSLSYEAFGLVVAESFAAATPVIVHAQGSLAEIVSTYGGGLMYRTTDELRAAMAQLLSSPSQCQYLGYEGRKAYEVEFAEDVFLQHYLDVVHVLLAEKRAGRWVSALGDSGSSTLAGRRVFFTPASSSSL